MASTKELANKLNLTITEDIEPVRQFTHYQMRPEYVTLHNAGSPSSGKGLHNYNRYSIRTSGDGVKSWHFSAGDDGIYQALPCNVNAWHAGDDNGDGNRKSIAIEIARDLAADRALYDKAEDNALRLAAVLLTAFGLGIDRLRKHQDWSGKYCPHKILSEGRWGEVVERVKSYMRQLHDGMVQPDQPAEKTIYRVQLGAFGGMENAERYKDICAAALRKAGVISDNPAENPFIVKG